MAETPFTSFRVYDSNGLQLTVSFPLDCNSVKDFSDSDAQDIHRAIETTLRNGFSVTQPGVGAGEEVETVGLIGRRAMINRNGDEIALIDLYPDTDNPEVIYKMATLYLDNDEQVADFEAGSGIHVRDIPFNEGSAPLNRTDRLAAKYLIVPNPKPRCVLKPNPQYNPDETDNKKKKPKRLFERWYGATASGTASPNEPSQTPTGSNGSTGAGDRNDASVKKPEHWAASEPARLAIKDRFAKYGVTGQAIADAIGKLEHGVTKLSESRKQSLKEYLDAIDAAYAQGGGSAGDEIPFDNPPFEPPYRWDEAAVKEFNARIEFAFPDIPAEEALRASNVERWSETFSSEWLRVKHAAAQENWRVRSDEIGYTHAGNSGYITFFSALGELRFYSTTEFAKLLPDSWVRANNVAGWKLLEGTRTIDPLVLAWSWHEREDGSGGYYMVDGVEPIDNLDAILNGAIP